MNKNNNEPFFKKSHGAWYVNQGSTQVRLSRDKAEAWTKWAGLQPNEVSAGTLAAMIDKYLIWLPANKRPGTVVSYKKYLTTWKAMHGHIGADSIRGHHVDELVSQRYAKQGNGKPYSDSVKWQCKKACVVLFGWLKSQGHINDNPLVGFKKNVACGVRQKFVAQDQYKALIACCPDPAFRDLLTVFWETGARPAEIFQATAKHLDRERHTLTFRAADGDYVKGKRKDRVRVIYLSVAAFEIVNRVSEGLIFSNAKGKLWSISDCVRRLATLEKRCHVKTSMYEFRHGYAHRKAAEGMPILTLAKLMGTSIKMLESIYTHLGDAHAHLLAAAG